MVDQISRLSNRLKELGLKDADLAKMINESPQTISNWKRRGQIPGAKAAKVAHALGRSADWLLSKNLVAESAPPPYAIGRRSFPRATSVEIPVYDVEGSIGIGRPLPEHDTVVGLQLSESWIRRTLPVRSLETLAVISAYGDSMEPTFGDGDILIVDRDITDIRMDGVYVFALHDEVYVKRIQRRPDGSLVIRSDNPLYESVTIASSDVEDLRILARVLWVWNGYKV